MVDMATDMVLDTVLTLLDMDVDMVLDKATLPLAMDMVWDMPGMVMASVLLMLSQRLMLMLSMELMDMVDMVLDTVLTLLDMDMDMAWDMATLPLDMVMAMVVDMDSMDKHEEEKSEIFFVPAFDCSCSGQVQQYVILYALSIKILCLKKK